MVLTRLLARLTGVLVLVGVAAVGGCASGPAQPGLKVGIAYDDRGPDDQVVNDLVRKGAAQAKLNLGSKITEVRGMPGGPADVDEDRYVRLLILCQSGYDPVIVVGRGYAGADPAGGPLARAVAACPKTRFAIVDDATVSKPTVANLVFADEQGGYLMGVAAALRSKTGTIGFIGGCRIPPVTGLEASYRAGAKAARPEVAVKSSYLADNPSDCGTGFVDSYTGEQLATRLYDGGVDVVFTAAGSSALGVLKAAKHADAWMIGANTDQFAVYGIDLRTVLLTSLVKHYDTAVINFLRDYAGGHFTAGPNRLDLRSGGVGYATSGGFLTAQVPELEAYRKGIIEGRIAVPGGV